MNWQNECVSALDSANMFEDSMHKSRFKELMDCYRHYPFLTKGLCKCMYLSAWDDEHFCIMLTMMNQMSISKETNTQEMRKNGDLLAEEEMGRDEYYIYQLSNAFLDNHPFHFDDDAISDERTLHVIRRALKAAEIIDALPCS